MRLKGDYGFGFFLGGRYVIRRMILNALSEYMKTFAKVTRKKQKQLGNTNVNPHPHEQ